MAIVERDRALEVLRSRHPVMVQAASLYAGASNSFHPWAPTLSLAAFDHWVLSELRSLRPSQVERKLLAVLFGLMKAAAFEHLLHITRGREAYVAALLSLPAPEKVRLACPTVPALDQVLVKSAISFETADAALGRPQTASEHLWAALDGLVQRVRHLRYLRGRMESAVRNVKRRDRRRHQDRAETVLAGIAVLATVVAAITLARPLLGW